MGGWEGGGGREGNREETSDLGIPRSELCMN